MKFSDKFYAIKKLLFSKEYILLHKNEKEFNLSVKCSATMFEAYLSEPLKECIKKQISEPTDKVIATQQAMP